MATYLSENELEIAFLYIFFMMVTEVSGVQFGLKYKRDFKIERAHTYDFRPKLHGNKFNYHFITFI